MLRTLEIARHNLVLQFQSRIFWILLLVSVASSFLFLMVPSRASSVGGDAMYRIAATTWCLSFFHPLVTLFFASQVTNSDLADRTSTYLFVRPLSRQSVLLGKVLATLAVSLLVAVAMLLALFALIHFSGRPWRGDALPTTDHLVFFVKLGAMASLAYTAIGTMFAAWFRRPMIWGVVFLVGWEQIISRLPPKAGVRSATVNDSIRRLVAIEYDPLTRFERNFLLDQLGRLDIDLMALGNPWWGLAKFTLVTLGTAALIYWVREYDSRPAE